MTSSTRTRRTIVTALMALLGMVTIVAAPAGAQAEPPALGFEIDVTEGRAGDTVNGQVDVADVTANCTTDLDEFQDRFIDFEAAVAELIFVTDEIIPTTATQVETYEQLSALLLDVVASGIFISDSQAADALAQTFVMTFATLTQEPVGERVNFDPAVGQASVTVPDLEPGLWAVAAACVGPDESPDLIRTAISQGASLLESEGVALPIDIADPGNLDLAQQFGVDLLLPVMQRDAVGAALFTVLGDTPGPGQPPTAPPATPVPGRPSFTG